MMSRAGAEVQLLPGRSQLQGSRPPIEVEVQLLSGRSVSVTVDRSWTGWELRAAVRHLSEDRLDVQKLFFGSHLIGNAQTVGELGLVDGDVLQVVVGEEGGQRGKDIKYQRIRELSPGSAPFHDTFCLLRNTETHEYCVLRQLDVGAIDREQRSDIVKEMVAWTRLQHPSLTRIQEVFRTKKSLCMVVEFVNDGTLKELLWRSGGVPISMALVLQHFAQLCLALEYMHEHLLVHGSLIARHVFLSHVGQIKLGGFYLARDLPETIRGEALQSFEIERGRACPEVLNGLPYNADSDLWALGVMLFEMATLTHPFVADSFATRLLLIREARYSMPLRLQGSSFPPLITQLLQRDAGLRASVASVLAWEPVSLAAIEANRRNGLGLDLSRFVRRAATPPRARSKAPELPEIVKPQAVQKMLGRPEDARPSRRCWSDPKLRLPETVTPGMPSMPKFVGLPAIRQARANNEPAVLFNRR